MGLALLAPARAQEPEPAPGPAGTSSALQLGAGSRVLLSRIQAGWLEWLSAVNADDSARAEKAVDDALAWAQQVEMRALPELSAAAALFAVEAAREGNSSRAGLALGAAEKLDAGRPETAFAGAKVAWAEGRYPSAAGQQLMGYVRAYSLPFERELLLNMVAGWLLRGAVLTVLIFLALIMVAKGALLYRDLLAFFGRYLPVVLAHVLALSLLAWPLILPDGLYWLALYWPLLLWPYYGRLARVLTIGGWLVLAAAPLILDEQARRLRGTLVPAMRSVESLARGRLPGTLLNDLADLETRLPDSPAVDHLLADAHRLLGQCDVARLMYQLLLEREANAAAYNDLGYCHFQDGSYSLAIDSFSEAASLRRSAIAQYNLSKSQAEVYDFSRSQLALQEARLIDSELVSRFVREDLPGGVSPWNGSFERLAEIRAGLGAAAVEGDDRKPWERAWRRGVFPPVLIVFLTVALGLRFLVRSSRGRGLIVSDTWFTGRAELWRRVLLPGCPEAEEGLWGRSLVSIFVPVALLTLPTSSAAGYSVPWGVDPGTSVLWAVALAGLALYGLQRLAFHYSRVA